MADHTYLAADLRTGTIVDELPLLDVSYAEVLNGAGGFTARLPMSAAHGDRTIAMLISASEPARTGLFIDRDGTIVWGGIIWTRRYATGRRALDLGGQQLWSYFRHRNLTATLSYTATDQGAIMKALIDHAQAKPGGNIGVTVPTPTASISRARTWYSYERQNIGRLVEALANVDSGPDFSLDCAYTAGVITKTFHSWWPRKGRIAGQTGHVFELPGNLVSYDMAEDATASATTVHAVGYGEGDNMALSTRSNTTLIDGGYPLLETVLALKDVKEQATLNGIVAAELAVYADAVTTWKAVVRADMDPVLGSWVVGDDCRVRITDDRFPAPGYDSYHRIIGATVKPGDGTTPEFVELDLADTF